MVGARKASGSEPGREGGAAGGGGWVVEAEAPGRVGGAASARVRPEVDKSREELQADRRIDFELEANMLGGVMMGGWVLAEFMMSLGDLQLAGDLENVPARSARPAHEIGALQCSTRARAWSAPPPVRLYCSTLGGLCQILRAKNRNSSVKSCALLACGTTPALRLGHNREAVLATLVELGCTQPRLLVEPSLAVRQRH